MNYVLFFVLVIFAGGHVYSYTQAQRLDGELATARAEIAVLSRALDERITTNANDLAALRRFGEDGAAEVRQRLDGLEADIWKKVDEQLTDKLVQAATSEAIKLTILERLPQSESFLMELGSILSGQFREELQGVPGEQVDPAVLAGLLARNEAFLDAIRFELVAEIGSGE